MFSWIACDGFAAPPLPRRQLLLRWFAAHAVQAAEEEAAAAMETWTTGRFPKQGPWKTWRSGGLVLISII